jgi:hypothetical protein
MVSKFADHLPLYRLEQIALRQGVPFRSTLADGSDGLALAKVLVSFSDDTRQRAYYMPMKCLCSN